MKIFDLFSDKPAEPLRYIPPCESGRFNERGTPIGYYVDALGREWSQESVSGSSNMHNGYFSSVWDSIHDIPHVNMPREESAAEEFQRTHEESWWKGGWETMQTTVSRSDIVDVTFEEVVE